MNEISFDHDDGGGSFGDLPEHDRGRSAMGCAASLNRTALLAMVYPDAEFIGYDHHSETARERARAAA
ncbi:MAG TPA: hypothetical protein VMF67_07490 [Rhizomicrobium sp.]|nr:hypothetical protein [Rhizomicrobium sp.]